MARRPRGKGVPKKGKSVPRKGKAKKPKMLSRSLIERKLAVLWELPKIGIEIAKGRPGSFKGHSRQKF